MIIKVHNDGKDKFMSVSATVEIPELIAYGPSELHALESLGHKIRNLIANLAKIDTTDEDSVVHADYKGDIL